MDSVRLEKRDRRSNQFRFYRLTILPNLFGEWSLAREWGRIGRKGHSRLDWFETRSQAEMALNALEGLKKRRGYSVRPEQLSLFGSDPGIGIAA